MHLAAISFLNLDRLNVNIVLIYEIVCLSHFIDVHDEPFTDLFAVISLREQIVVFMNR